MESREESETHREDREQGTPQEELLDEQARPDGDQGHSEEDIGAPEEGGADSPADAAGEGG
jgi:hypothetical protein